MDLFQPTLPVRGVTKMYTNPWSAFNFQPTLPVRGVTRHGRLDGQVCSISTHTPRAGSDGVSVFVAHPDTDFNPHSPCGE